MAEVEVLIQVNGKPKARIMTAAEITKDELAKVAVENETVKAAIGTGKVVKVIAVPGRLVNIVIKK